MISRLIDCEIINYNWYLVLIISNFLGYFDWEMLFSNKKIIKNKNTNIMLLADIFSAGDTNDQKYYIFNNWKAEQLKAKFFITYICTKYN